MSALVKREIVEVTETYVIIDEIWDTSHPDCPYVLVPPIPFDEAIKRGDLKEYWNE